MAGPEIDEGGDEGEDWLVSYADMITLIACFFILMMAFANFDPVGFQKKSKELSKHFRKDKNKSSETKMKFLMEELSKHPNVKDMSKVSMKDGALVVTFSGTALFERGAFELKPEVMDTIDSMIDMIRTTNPDFRILISGHTNDISLGKRKSDFQSNWVLSSARAAAIVERFEYFGFNPNNIVAIGKGASQPIAPTRDKEGRIIRENLALNRRVEIKVLEPVAKNKVKMGFGVFFQEAVEDKPKEAFIDEQYTQ